MVRLASQISSGITKKITINAPQENDYNVFDGRLKSHVQSLQKITPLFIAQVKMTVIIVIINSGVVQIPKEEESNAVFMKHHEILHVQLIKRIGLKSSLQQSVKRLKWRLRT